MFYVARVISYFNVIAYYLAEGLPEWQPNRAVRTMAARNKYCKNWLRAGLEPAAFELPVQCLIYQLVTCTLCKKIRSFAHCGKKRLHLLYCSAFKENSLITRFHVSFWLSHNLAYLFYFCTSFCPTWDRSIINKAMAKAEKGHGNGVKVIDDNKCRGLCSKSRIISFLKPQVGCKECLFVVFMLLG